MGESRTKNTSRNITWGMMNKLILLCLSFTMRTVMIYTMGVLYLGLNGLFTSVLQVLNVSELGISSAIVFSMYKQLAEGKEDEVCALMNLYKQSYRIIGMIVMILGLAVLPFLDRLITGEIPADINLYILYLMNLGSTVLSYELFTYRTALLTAVQRNDVVSKIHLVAEIVQAIFQLLVLFVLKNYYIYVLCIIAGTVIKNIAGAVVCKRMYPQYICRGNVPSEVFQNIKKRVGGMIFQKIGGVVLASVDTLVISAFLGLKILAVYQNYYLIISALFTVLAVISSAMVAPIGNSVALESIDKNYQDFKKFNFIYIWIVSWCTVCLLCMYQPFMKLWVGQELMLPMFLVCLFAVYFFIHKWCDMLFVYQEACGIWWETRFVPILAAGINLAVNLILVNIIGLAGILISTVISVLFIYDIGYAVVLFKVYFKSKKNMYDFFIRQIFYLVTVLCSVAITWFLCNRIQLSTVTQLLLNAFICLIVPNIIFVVAWHRLPEFTRAVRLVKKIMTERLGRKQV